LGEEKRPFDAVIFDVDGVLVDVSRSYEQVVKSVVLLFLRLKGRKVDFDHRAFVASAKETPYFNDDYDLAFVAFHHLATSGRPDLGSWRERLKAFHGAPTEAELIPLGEEVGVDYRLFRRTCFEVYFGGETLEELKGWRQQVARNRRGFWELESPLVGFHHSRVKVPVGLFTGRDRDEVELALRKLGWQDLDRSRVYALGDGEPKPSPEGLFRLSRTMGFENPLYLGDSASDERALSLFGRGSFVRLRPNGRGETEMALRDRGLL